MNNLPREQLKYIITQYGRSLSEDPQRCEAFLRDLCGQYRKEINVLVSAVKEQVPTDLLTSQNSVPSDLLLARLSKRLEDRLGLSQESAKWGVESWALALGIISERELKNEVGKQAAFEQNLKWQESQSKAQAEQDRVTKQLESERLAAESAARAEQDRKLREQQIAIKKLEAEIAARAEETRRHAAFEQNLKRREAAIAARAEQDRKLKEQQQLESQTWNQKSLNSQAIESNNTDLEIQRITRLKIANQKIKVGWIAGYISSVPIFILLLSGISSYGINQAAIFLMLWFLLQIGLSYGIQKKSRFCTLCIVTFYVPTSAMFIVAVLFSILTNQIKISQIGVGNLLCYFIIVIFSTCCVIGMQGIIEYYKLKKYNNE